MATKDKASDAFTAEEKAAMQEHVKAEKAAARKAAKGETDPSPRSSRRSPSCRSRTGHGERIHEIVKEAAPNLSPGCTTGCRRSPRPARPVLLPAREQVQVALLHVRVQRRRMLDDGSMWATSWGITKLTDADEKKLAERLER